nr:MAG: polyprotein [Wufeng shrew picornavirus 5]
MVLGGARCTCRVLPDRVAAGRSLASSQLSCTMESETIFSFQTYHCSQYAHCYFTLRVVGKRATGLSRITRSKVYFFREQRIEIDWSRRTPCFEILHGPQTTRDLREIPNFRMMPSVTMKAPFKNFGVAASRVSNGNKHQMAHAGGNITQINYYGSDYANAKGDPSLQMDPEKFTKPITDLAMGPALKSPSVEECGYSDRIAQLTTGNSTITTQEAANAVVAYAQWPEHTSVGESIDLPTTPGPAVDRFYTLDSYDWTKTTKGYAIRLPGALNNLGMFGQNVHFHYLMKSGFCVHLQCNASKFHQGCLLVAAIPECELDDNTITTATYTTEDGFYNRYPKNQMTLFPHQFVNLRTNNSATLILPYINAVPAENAQSHNFWTIVITPVTPLDYSAGASTVVPITISIAPMCSEFSGLRGSVTQGVPVFQIPGSGQFVSTLANEGFPIIPQYEPTTPHKIPGEVNNLLEVARVDTMCNPNGNNTFLYIEVSNGKDTPIRTWDMTMTSAAFGPTYLARLTKWYTHWHGSVNITFTFCGSAMATGKLLIAYTPPGGSAPQTRTEAMLGTHMIWDIGLQSSANFVVPWISQTVYRFANIDSDKLSLGGYITMFYQTAIVVPPGAPSTCPILMFLSAGNDFVMRLATDNAYFQGLGEDIGKLITNVTHQAITENVPTTLELSPPSQVPNQLSIQTGNAASLTAVETGASSDVQPDQVMETRLIKSGISGRETGVENFFSRYGLFWFQTQAKSNNIYTVDLTFNETSTTSTAMRAKYNMFTYFRCDFDIIVQIIPGYNVQNASSNIVAQMVYCPPGCPAPQSYSDMYWGLPTTPNVFFKSQDPPASVRVPFMGVASAYVTSYDGRATFSAVTGNTTYGHFPGNNLGKLCIKLANRMSSDSFVYGIYMYARPVNVRAFCPRPILTQKTKSKVGPSTGRLVFVNTDGGDDVEHNVNGQDLRMKQFGKVQVLGTPLGMQQLQKAPIRQWVTAREFTVVQSNLPGQDPYLFMGMPMDSRTGDRLIGVSLHLCQENLNWNGHPLEIVHKDPTHDFAVLKCPKSFGSVRCCTCTVPSGCWTIGFGSWSGCAPCDALQWCDELTIVASDFLPEHVQRDIFFTESYIPEGWCSSPLICCCGGVVGIATCGDHDHKLYGYTSVRHIPRLQEYMESGRHNALVVQYEESMTTSSQLTDDRYASDYESDDEMEVDQEQEQKLEEEPMEIQEQGPTSWLNGLATQMGDAFANGAMNKVGEELSNFSKIVTDGIGEAGKLVINWLTKILCSIVLIKRSDNKMETAAVLGTMLGIDFFTQNPFETLKHKINQILKVNRIEEQGASDWAKDFTTFCNAARGFEWILKHLKAFVEWLTARKEEETQGKRRLEDLLMGFPDLMKSIDKIAISRGKYREDDIRAVINEMKDLKELCDLYGVERNFTTGQIFKYYQKVQTFEQSLTKPRHEPVALLIHGTPGAGKSLATDLIGRALSAKVNEGRPYSLPPDPKHFDGYSKQLVTIMDDVGQNPDGEDLKLFCQMVSSTTFQVPMASLEEKGMPFESQFVLCSTNCEVLRPPTISEPEALARRFYLDMDIVLTQNFKTKTGRLDTGEALIECMHGAKNFKKCCPLICGQAIKLQDRRTKALYSVDEVTSLLWEENNRRKNCGSFIDALFQGPGRKVGLLREACTHVEEKEMPPELAELVAHVPTQEVLAYIVEKNYRIGGELYDKIILSETTSFLKMMKYGLITIGVVSAISMGLYMLFSALSVAYEEQGPKAYSGAPAPVVKKPELRRQVKVQGPVMDFATKIMKSSLFDVRTYKGSFSGLGLYENKLLLPVHADPLDSIILDDKVYNVLDRMDLHNDLGNLELCVITIDRPVSFRDIRKYLPEFFNTEKNCVLVVNNANYRNMFAPIGTVTPWGYVSLSGTPTYNTCTYAYPTKTGQCGGVVCTENRIIALHIGGDGRNGYGAILKRSFFTSEQGKIVKQTTIATPINVNTKTKLRPSVFFDVFEGTKEPAALSKYDSRLEVDLESAMFGKYKGNSEKVPEMLEVAVEHYVQQLKPLLPDDVLEPLPLEDVVYGLEKLEGLDLNTSAGYPYVTMGVRKRDLIPERGQSLDKLKKCLDEYGVDLPYVTYLKDELRPKEKVKMGKTRLIECSSLNDTIRMKTVFGRLFQVFHSNPGTVTGSAVGCNPDTDWTLFRRELEGSLVAFDYSNYDASLSPFWFDALKLVLRKIGYSDKDLKCIDHICYSKHLYRNVEYDVVGGMPSGCSGTSIFNSIINNLIIRTLVLECYKGIHLDSLKVVAYGDDVVCSYLYPLDASILAEEGSKYGLTMTPPDKTADFNEVTWDNVTFLKRRFVPDEEFPFLIHPVFPMSEIHESIRWTRSAAHTQEHVSSLCLLAWHAGKEQYEEFVNTIRSVNVGKMLNLPSYSVLRQEWLDQF